jgi:hypothetical protein
MSIPIDAPAGTNAVVSYISSHVPAAKRLVGIIRFKPAPTKLKEASK